MDQDGIVAIGLLTRRDLDLLGPTFKWAWPIDELLPKNAPGAPEQEPAIFRQLLRAIDEADEELHR